jgi:hypothetical protein
MPAQVAPAVNPLGSGGQLPAVGGLPVADPLQSTGQAPATKQRATGNALSTEDLHLLPAAPAAPTAAVDRGALGTTTLSDGTGRRAEALPSLPVGKSTLDQVTATGLPMGGRTLDNSPLLSRKLTAEPISGSRSIPLTEAPLNQTPLNQSPLSQAPLNSALAGPASPLGGPTVSSLGAPNVTPIGAPTVSSLGAPTVNSLGAPTVNSLGAPTVKSEALPILGAVPGANSLGGQDTSMSGITSMPVLRGLVANALTSASSPASAIVQPDARSSATQSRASEALPVVGSLPVVDSIGGQSPASQSAALQSLTDQGFGRPGLANRGSSSPSVPVVGGLLNPQPAAPAPASASTGTQAKPTSPRPAGAHRHRVAPSSDQRPVAGEDTDF